MFPWNWRPKADLRDSKLQSDGKIGQTEREMNMLLLLSTKRGYRGVRSQGTGTTSFTVDYKNFNRLVRNYDYFRREHVSKFVYVDGLWKAMLKTEDNKIQGHTYIIQRCSYLSN